MDENLVLHLKENISNINALYFYNYVNEFNDNSQNILFLILCKHMKKILFSCLILLINIIFILLSSPFYDVSFILTLSLTIILLSSIPIAYFIHAWKIGKSNINFKESIKTSVGISGFIYFLAYTAESLSAYL